jgi:hypothetical protein
MASEADPVRIVIEISRADPFRGTIAEAGRPVQGLNGWTAFASAIAAAVRRIGAPRDAESPDVDVGG